MTGAAGSEASSGGPGVTAPVEPEGFGDAHTIAEPLTLFLRQTGAVRFLPVGPRALLVELDDAAAARSLAAWVRHRRIAAVDVVPAARTVLIDGVRDLAATRDALAGWDVDRPETADGGLVDFTSTTGGVPTGEARVKIAGLSRSGLVLTSRPIDLSLVLRLTPDRLETRAVIDEGGQRRGRLQGRIAGLPAPFPDRAHPQKHGASPMW